MALAFIIHLTSDEVIKALEDKCDGIVTQKTCGNAIFWLLLFRLISAE